MVTLPKYTAEGKYVLKIKKETGFYLPLYITPVGLKQWEFRRANKVTQVALPISFHCSLSVDLLFSFICFNTSIPVISFFFSSLSLQLPPLELLLATRGPHKISHILTVENSTTFDPLQGFGAETYHQGLCSSAHNQQFQFLKHLSLGFFFCLLLLVTSIT